MTLDSLEGRTMKGKSRIRGRGLLQVSVARLMMLVAMVALLWSAWLYHREYADVERSWVSIHLRDLHHDEAIQRRWAAENLDRAEADDVARVVTGLAGALGDPESQVSRAAARSLASVIQRRAANHTAALSGELDLAIRALVSALGDPRTEVRIAAVESVGKLADICRASPGAPGGSAATSAVLPEAKQAVAALLRAMRDPAFHVRAEAVRTLGRVGPSAGIDWGPIEEAAENDPAFEVRTAAINALTTGWLEQVRNEDVLGR